MLSIIGRGNVASHLYSALKDSIETEIINPRTLENLPENPEIILIAVSDDAIAEIVDRLPVGNYVLAHTSGSVPMSVLTGKTPNIGVFYPLQTFTKDLDLDYKIIPVFLEGATPEALSALENLARLFSEDVRMADSEARRHLHLSSVFACNFNNALAGIAYEIVREAGIDFNALIPLLTQTVNKLKHITPREAQTGPAVRNDRKVIEAHLKMLEPQPEYHEIYNNITHLIQKK